MWSWMTRARKIAQGTAPDRIISITEPEMRHGRKSSTQRFDGFKVARHRADQRNDPGHRRHHRPGSDGKELMPTIERVEQHAE